MKKLFLCLTLAFGASWVSGQTLQLPADTLRHWYAIKKSTERVLTIKGTLYEARSAEVDGLRELIAIKDERIATLEQMNTSYSKSLSKSQSDATKYEAQAKRRGRTIWTLAVLFLGSVTLHLAK